MQVIQRQSFQSWPISFIISVEKRQKKIEGIYTRVGLITREKSAYLGPKLNSQREGNGERSRPIGLSLSISLFQINGHQATRAGRCFINTFKRYKFITFIFEPKLILNLCL